MKTYTNKDFNEVPRVSTIVSLLSKPYLYEWNNVMGLKGINTKEYVIETAEIGSMVHEAIEHHMEYGDDMKLLDIARGKPDNVQADIFYAFDKYIASSVYESIENPTCELTLTNGRFGGTIDVICDYKGDRTLLDIKTSNQLSDSHKLQLAAYMWLLEDNGYDVDKYGILLIPVRDKKKCKFYEIDKYKIKIYRNIFEHLLGIYEAQQELKQKR